MSWARDRTLMLRRVRHTVISVTGELIELRDRLQVELLDLNGRLATARDIVLALRAEVVAARDTHPTLADRLAAIETRLPPPTP